MRLEQSHPLGFPRTDSGQLAGGDAAWDRRAGPFERVYDFGAPFSAPEPYLRSSIASLAVVVGYLKLKSKSVRRGN